MTPRRWILTTAAVAALATACTPTTPDIAWSHCTENAEFDCATLQVPIDWTRPDGETIDLALIRRPATDRAHRIGALISLPGGPGTSGVDEILHGKFSPRLRERFDIISLDPRGVGRSHPLRCDAGLAARFPDPIPDLGARLDDIHSYARTLARTCRDHTGPLIDHLDAASVARDIEQLRHTLDEDRLSIYSRSYGTMPAQSYAELFPTRLRALVLDSVDDHSLDGTGFLDTEARAAQDTFEEFASWCAREPACPLHDRDPHRIFDDLYAAASHNTLRDPHTPDRPLAPMDLSVTVIKQLYAPDWPALADQLRALLDQPATTPLPPIAPPTPSGAPAPMPGVIACSDWQFDLPDQHTWQRAWHTQNTLAPTLRAHFAWTAASICSGWPIAPANPPHPPRVIDGPPILVLSSLHDPATPHEWARQVTTRTDRATMLTYHGWGHGVYDRTACTTTATDDYLISLIPPTTDCPAA
ncbi:alpha/beta hydrolase [Nocardia pseudobrasiliensis]|uniref:Alpha/beta hydrolase family protein n=1 Tax=Nocardia pseudobrasiliensis TaxID=45979 RepID=A0A370I3G0_9NOCA|nr:alpha/beta hydrolase [Nocardia pseudobrasiliensis]RDI65256.1 alpha/beta hydrolase family protein [Nocardia pseudobrasiliensis]